MSDFSRDGTIKLIGHPKQPYHRSSKRSLFWHEIQEWNGQPVQDFLDWYADNPLCKTQNAITEPASGWINFCIREGLLEIVK